MFKELFSKAIIFCAGRSSLVAIDTDTFYYKIILILLREMSVNTTRIEVFTKISYIFIARPYQGRDLPDTGKTLYSCILNMC